MGLLGLKLKQSWAAPDNLARPDIFLGTNCPGMAGNCIAGN